MTTLQPAGPPLLNTKDQTMRLFALWNVTEPLPKKGKKVIINFPPGVDNQFPLAEVTLYPGKSTYGKKLYSIQFMRKLELKQKE